MFRGQREGGLGWGVDALKRNQFFLNICFEENLQVEGQYRSKGEKIAVGRIELPQNNFVSSDHPKIYS